MQNNHKSFTVVLGDVLFITSQSLVSGKWPYLKRIKLTFNCVQVKIRDFHTWNKFEWQFSYIDIVKLPKVCPSPRQTLSSPVKGTTYLQYGPNIAPKMNITNLFQLFASFVQINMWSCFIIFSLIQMTTSFKYDIIKITFSRHFCNFSIKRRVFKQFFFRKHWAITLTKCFHHICIYPRLISDKHFFLVQSVALSFPFKTR